MCAYHYPWHSVLNETHFPRHMVWEITYEYIHYMAKSAMI